jgi:hypothetical protein
MNKQLNTAQAMLSVLGVLAWLIAGAFGLMSAVSIVAAGGVCGFAIAGGLCFLGTAIIARGSHTETKEAAGQTTDIPETKH